MFHRNGEIVMWAGIGTVALEVPLACGIFTLFFTTGSF